jgi:hypothetical protein
MWWFWKKRAPAGPSLTGVAIGRQAPPEGEPWAADCMNIHAAESIEAQASPSWGFWNRPSAPVAPVAPYASQLELPPMGTAWLEQSRPRHEAKSLPVIDGVVDVRYMDYSQVPVPSGRQVEDVRLSINRGPTDDPRLSDPHGMAQLHARMNRRP